MTLAMTATRQAMQQVLQMHLPSNLAAENCRLTAEVQRLQHDNNIAVDHIADMYIAARVNARNLERYMRRHIKPRMRSKQDLRWLDDELNQDGNLPYILPELWWLINLTNDPVFFGAMEDYKDVNNFAVRVANIMARMDEEEYVDWSFIAPDFNTLRQIREDAHGFTQTGLVIHYDNNGLAQAPRQEAMI